MNPGLSEISRDVLSAVESLPLAQEYKTVVLLVAAGLKKAGELRFEPYVSRYKAIATQLDSVGLETCMTRYTVDRFLDCEPHDADCMRPKLGDVVPYQLLFWQKGCGFDKERAVNSYISDPQEFGRLMGYPECCVDAFAGEESARKYQAELNERYHELGIAGIEHLVGIEHVPCSIDCHETIMLGYAPFLRRHAPEMYATSRRVLVSCLYAA
ncbi:DUF483 domain-containing protein [Candidatus Woesearchaeota archaeon]|nr:DUF483 domain-containing protein [Candidatus Woesearchaeota archaeon]